MKLVMNDFGMQEMLLDRVNVGRGHINPQPADHFSLLFI
jgi:hypothetical protein